MRVAVTGASGVVGGAVARHLVAAGHDVACLSRSAASDALIDALGATPVRGDVLSPETLSAAFEGCEQVFHVAGVNEMCGRDPHHMFAVNVDGSRAVVRAADEAGVSRVVHTSSTVALGEERGSVGSEESAHRGSFLSNYERSKYEAERAVLAMEVSTDIVVVNPSSVQGPGRATGTAKIILDVLAGRLPVMLDVPLSVVDIDDCARGHLLAAEHGDDRRRYVLNSFTLSMSEALALTMAAAQRSPRVRLVPPWVVAPLGPLLDLAEVAGIDVPYCREMLRTVAHGHRYDGSRATGELGLVYTAPAEAIGRMVDWFVAQGLLDSPAA